MNEEGALHVFVAEAPTDQAEQFLALADRILQTLTFSGDPHTT